MKAEIKGDGTLIVSSETELESYALTKWSDDDFLKKAKLLVKITVVAPDPIVRRPDAYQQICHIPEAARGTVRN